MRHKSGELWTIDVAPLGATECPLMNQGMFCLCEI
jgi:hypothetical protein